MTVEYAALVLAVAACIGVAWAAFDHFLLARRTHAFKAIVLKALDDAADLSRNDLQKSTQQTVAWFREHNNRTDALAGHLNDQIKGVERDLQDTHFALERALEALRTEVQTSHQAHAQKLVELDAKAASHQAQLDQHDARSEQHAEQLGQHAAKLDRLCDQAPAIWQTQAVAPTAGVATTVSAGSPGHPLAHVPYVYMHDADGTPHYACRYCSEKLG